MSVLPGDLATELSAMKRLHAVATRLIEGSSLASLLQEILDAAIEVVRADQGLIQLFDPATCELQLVVQERWHVKHAISSSPCASWSLPKDWPQASEVPFDMSLARAAFSL